MNIYEVPIKQKLGLQSFTWVWYVNGNLRSKNLETKYRQQQKASTLELDLHDLNSGSIFLSGQLFILFVPQFLHL